MLHGSDLQALATLKQQLATHTEDLEKERQSKMRAEETLVEVKNAGTVLQVNLSMHLIINLGWGTRVNSELRFSSKIPFSNEKT